MSEVVECLVCNTRYRRITSRHLATHNLNHDSYRDKFPGAPTCSEVSSSKMSQFWSTEQGREVKKKTRQSFIEFNKRYNGTDAHKKSSKLGGVVGAKRLNSSGVSHDRSVELSIKDDLEALGFKYNKGYQHSPGKGNSYRPDYSNDELKIILEVDGWSHNSSYQQDRDKEKDKFFRNLGYRVIRVTNEDVVNNKQLILTKVKEVCNGIS